MASFPVASESNAIELALMEGMIGQIMFEPFSLLGRFRWTGA